MQKSLKQIFIITLTAVFLISCQKDTREKPQQEKRSVVILFETDVHCAVDGYPYMAGLRDAIADTSWTFLVSSGDYLQGGTPGAISRGQYIVDIMRSMRYDAVALGNHEFDYQVPRLQELMVDFNAPVVCCNFTDMQGNLVVAPYTVRSFGNRKIAFVGVLTPETELTGEPFAFRDGNGQRIYSLHGNEYVTMVQQAVDDARREGADYVVLLSHMGETAVGNSWPSNSLIAATHGIDAVLDGHSHNVVDTVIANSQGQLVPLANTGTKFANIGKLWIGADGRMDVTLIPAAQFTQVSSTVNAVVENVRQQVEALTGQVVAHSDFPLLISDSDGNRLVRTQETNAGDLMTDALRWLMDADIGMVNGGGLRSDVQAGDITYSDIINLAPYDNYMMKIEATGAQILEVLRQCTASLPGEDGDFPQVSGLRYTVNVADHSVTHVEVLQADGSYAPLSPTATYTVGASDYVVVLGGFHGLLADCTMVQYTTTLYRDGLVRYITEVLGGTVSQEYAVPQGRITINR